MLGWKIFVHSVRMVFGNLKQAFQITLGPAVITTLVLIGLVVLLGVPLDAIDPETGSIPIDEAPFSLLLFLGIFLALIWITAFWVAVSWHRFILLEEYPKGILPKFRFDRILAYLGRAFLLGLLMIVSFLPMTFLLSVLANALGGFSAVLIFGYLIVVLIFLFRLSIVLPSVAIGSPLSFSEAWEQTRGSSASVFVLLLTAIVFQFLLQMLFFVVAFVPILGVIVTILVSLLIVPLINVSILTTMYGVFIEKRELT